MTCVLTIQLWKYHIYKLRSIPCNSPQDKEPDVEPPQEESFPRGLTAKESAKKKASAGKKASAPAKGPVKAKAAPKASAKKGKKK